MQQQEYPINQVCKNLHLIKPKLPDIFLLQSFICMKSPYCHIRYPREKSRTGCKYASTLTPCQNLFYKVTEKTTNPQLIIVNKKNLLYNIFVYRRLYLYRVVADLPSLA